MIFSLLSVLLLFVALIGLYSVKNQELFSIHKSQYLRSPAEVGPGNGGNINVTKEGNIEPITLSGNNGGNSERVSLATEIISSEVIQRAFPSLKSGSKVNIESILAAKKTFGEDFSSHLEDLQNDIIEKIDDFFERADSNTTLDSLSNLTDEVMSVTQEMAEYELEMSGIFIAALMEVISQYPTLLERRDNPFQILSFLIQFPGTKGQERGVKAYLSNKINKTIGLDFNIANFVRPGLLLKDSSWPGIYPND